MHGATNYEVMILTGARERVTQGWTKGKSYDAYGNVCAGQALSYSLDRIYRAASPREQEAVTRAAQRAEVLLLDVADELGQGRWFHIPEWNDVYARTKGQVLAAFDRAIVKAGGMPAAEVVTATTEWTPTRWVASPAPPPIPIPVGPIEQAIRKALAGVV